MTIVSAYSVTSIISGIGDTTANKTGESFPVLQGRDCNLSLIL